MTHTTHEALRELDRVAAEIESKNLPFDMSEWGNPACGTEGCLAGWAMIYPWFKEHGLVTVEEGTEPNYRGADSTHALEEFFGLEGSETDRLFFAYTATVATQRAVIADLLATVEDRRVP